MRLRLDGQDMKKILFPSNTAGNIIKVLDKTPLGEFFSSKELAQRVGVCLGYFRHVTGFPELAGYSLSLGNRRIWGSKKTIVLGKKELKASWRP